MGLSHMCISIILSFEGTDKARITGYASIAFFTIVSTYNTAWGQVASGLTDNCSL